MRANDSSRCAAVPVRVVSTVPVAVQDLVSGWKNSAELATPRLPVSPPATGTLRSGKATQTCPARASRMGLAGESVRCFANYPARGRELAGVCPPVRKERPSGRAAQQAALGDVGMWRGRVEAEPPPSAPRRQAGTESDGTRAIKNDETKLILEQSFMLNPRK